MAVAGHASEQGALAIHVANKTVSTNYVDFTTTATQVVSILYLLQNYPIHTNTSACNIERRIDETPAYALGLPYPVCTSGSLSIITALSTIVGVLLNLVIIPAPS